MPCIHVYDDELDQLLLQNVQLGEPQTRMVGTVTSIMHVMRIRLSSSCSLLSGLPQMNRLAQWAWHPIMRCVTSWSVYQVVLCHIHFHCWCNLNRRVGNDTQASVLVTLGAMLLVQCTLVHSVWQCVCYRLVWALGPTQKMLKYRKFITNKVRPIVRVKRGAGTFLYPLASCDCDGAQIFLMIFIDYL